MPIDPNIALQVKPLQLNDPLAQYAQVSQIQNAQNQNALAQYQLESAQRENEYDKGVKNYLATKPDLTSPTTQSELLNFGKPGLGYAKLISEQQTNAMQRKKLANEIQKQQQDFEIKATNDLALNPSRENIIAWGQNALIEGRGTPEEIQAKVDQYLAMEPGKLQQYLIQKGASSKELIAAYTSKPVQKTDNQTTWMIEGNPNLPTFGKKIEVVPTIQMKPTPGQDLANETAKGQLAVAQFNAATNRARLELQRNAPKLGLTNQDDIDAVAVAIANGKLPVDRVNSTTAPLFAKLLKANPDIDFTKLTTDQANALSAARSGGTIAGRQELTGTDKTQAQNIASGNLPPVTGPNAGKIMNEVLAIKPDYNANDYQLQTAAQKSFNTGKQGDKTRSLNVAVSHLGVLENAANALHAGNTPAINQFKQAWQRETGKIGPTSFNAVKELVADEIVAAVVPGVGSLADRKALKDTIMAKSSPAQLQGVIKQYKELLGGQLSGLEQQYTATTRKTDFKERYLLPETKRALMSSSSGAPNAAAAAAPSAVTIKNDSDYNNLPSGTLFTGPDGIQRRKP